MSSLIKICPVGAESFHADGQMDGRTDGRTNGQADMTKLTVAFRNFANAPKKLRHNLLQQAWTDGRAVLSFKYGQIRTQTNV